MATRRRGRRSATATPARKVSYHPIHNRLPHPEVFSADQVASIHDTALRVLEELGIRVLHDEGLRWFREAGAQVDDDSQMVHIDRGLVAQALKTAPTQFTVAGGRPGREVPVGGNSLHFAAGAGCPNITDIERGRRPGTLADFIETVKLQQSFDILPKLALSDKVPFVYARGQGQTLDNASW